MLLLILSVLSIKVLILRTHTPVTKGDHIASKIFVVLHLEYM